MTLYNVHIYREMRLYFPTIEAGTPECHRRGILQEFRTAGTKESPNPTRKEQRP